MIFINPFPMSGPNKPEAASQLSEDKVEGRSKMKRIFKPSYVD